ncbi:hypothetical protein GCM10028895_27480 [Pontibacter rugosus]
MYETETAVIGFINIPALIIVPCGNSNKVYQKSCTELYVRLLSTKAIDMVIKAPTNARPKSF